MMRQEERERLSERRVFTKFTTIGTLDLPRASNAPFNSPYDRDLPLRAR